MPRVDLTIPFDTPALRPPHNVSSDFQLSTLSNGLRVLSDDPHSAISSVGVFIDSGSRYELNSAKSGISNFLETIAFQSTKNRSHFRLVREMQKVRATFF